MTARGEGLARWRAARAEALWPKLRAALDKMLAEHGAPNLFHFSEIAQQSGLTPREIGSVLRSGGAAAAWMRERGATIEARGRSTVLAFGDADDAPGVSEPPALPPTPAAPVIEESKSGDWLPSLL